MGCQCPPDGWGGIYPPPCDVHNPPGPRSLRDRLERADSTRREREVREAVREELERLLAPRRADPEFRERLARRLEEDATVLRRLR
jgi:predicted component of type VI protein secretion system